jgi:hypothetical protein
MSHIAGEHVKQPIASRSLPVFDPAMGIHRQVIAGQEVPSDLVEVYAKALTEREQATVVKPNPRSGRKPEATPPDAPPADE